METRGHIDLGEDLFSMHLIHEVINARKRVAILDCDSVDKPVVN